MLCYFAVLSALIWEWAGGTASFASGSAERGPGFGHRRLAVAPLVAGVALLFVAELALVALSAHSDGAALRSGGYPLEIMDDRNVTVTWRREAVSFAVFGIVLLQAFGLYRLYRVLTCIGRPQDVATVALGASAMVFAAVLAPALGSADMYAYAADAMLGATAYHPTTAMFHGAYAPIAAWWHFKIQPAPYGPLWLAYDRGLLQFAPTLLAKLELTRILGASWFAFMIACLARRLSPAALALVALNPALIYLFVANGHNDIIALALIVAALTLAEERPALQVALGIAAALVKLPFVLVAVVALSGSQRTRLVAALALLVGTAGFSYLFGGQPYVDALLQHTGHRAGAYGWPHTLVQAITLGAIAAALLRQKWSRTASFTFASLGAVIFPWYAAWGMPYAITSRSVVGFMVGLPIACFLFETVYDTRIALGAVIVTFSVLAVRAVLSPPSGSLGRTTVIAKS